MKSTEPELVFTRIVAAPREKVFKAWTDPAELRRWLAPAPWTVSVAVADPRPGAASMVLLASPDGSELLTVMVTFHDLGASTRYRARVRHWMSSEREAEVE